MSSRARSPRLPTDALRASHPFPGKALWPFRVRERAIQPSEEAASTGVPAQSQWLVEVEHRTPSAHKTPEPTTTAVTAEISPAKEPTPIDMKTEPTPQTLATSERCFLVYSNFV